MQCRRAWFRGAMKSRRFTGYRSMVIPTVALLIALLMYSICSTAQMAPKPVVQDPGLAIDPTLSADGRWLAYASDRGGSRFLNLWLRPLAGGEPRRLTEEASDHREPAFSPDGRTIAYRSEAKGGGIYLLAIDGGRSRLL